jgi:hypothetical protein
MALIGQPTEGPVVDADGNAKPGYKDFFSQVFRLLVALTLSGTTLNRPTTFLFVGRIYFDTTLGKPVWFKNPGWVDATGAPA